MILKELVFALHMVLTITVFENSSFTCSFHVSVFVCVFLFVLICVISCAFICFCVSSSLESGNGMDILCKVLIWGLPCKHFSSISL